MSLLIDIILAGGYYFPIKASLHLVQESILFLGKESNHSLAFPLQEKGKKLDISIYILILLHLTKFNKAIKMSSGIIRTNTRKLLSHHKIQQSRLNFIKVSIRSRCSNRCA